MSVELGPGMIENIYDGIQRPLEKIMEKVHGNNLPRGVEVPPIDPDKLWDFTPVAKAGDKVVGGDIIGTVQETSLISHKIMVPPGVMGTLKEISGGSHTVTEVIAKVDTDNGTTVDIQMLQRWPVRRQRPSREKISPWRTKPSAPKRMSSLSVLVRWLLAQERQQRASRRLVFPWAFSPQMTLQAGWKVTVWAA